MEPNRRPTPGYIEKLQKKHINVGSRAIWVSGLVEAAEYFGLLSETLHLAVSYMDRFLSTDVLHLRSIALPCLASLLIAA
ncbi:hypothetical protein M8C21_014311 [Ambrosia artemisiifolia]|uniref:Cyclin N-terminal domain-containing protein n=1 Tax=Ambrosia artemisiifolia TaxID=4212 RepID=A0AAD5CHW3_AMBAR|nr:hypothetical protein M8C21_014311 [Ambrosia artemisiifolia]